VLVVSKVGPTPGPAPGPEPDVSLEAPELRVMAAKTTNSSMTAPAASSQGATARGLDVGVPARAVRRLSTARRRSSLARFAAGTVCR